MRSLEDTPSESRFFQISAQLSCACLQELQEEVNRTLDRLANRPLDWGLIQRYQNADLSGCIFVYSEYSYADVPLGTKFDLAFSWNASLTAHPVSVTLEYVLIDLAGLSPISPADHGHKHILVLRPHDDTIQELPQVTTVDSLREIMSTNICIGLCQAQDWPAIQKRLQTLKLK